LPGVMWRTDCQVYSALNQHQLPSLPNNYNGRWQRARAH
jgi:hypothetical protein